MPSFRGSSPPRDRTQVSCIEGRFFTTEPPGKPKSSLALKKSKENKQAFLVAWTVKNPPAMRETWVWSVDREDLLEEGMETYFSTLAWRIPWTEEPGGWQSMGSQRVGYVWATKHKEINQTLSSFISHSKSFLPFVAKHFPIVFIYCGKIHLTQNLPF